MYMYVDTWEYVFIQTPKSAVAGYRAEVPSHRVATHYMAVEEFLPGRENVLGTMWIDITLCYLLCVNDCSNPNYRSVI